MLVETRLIKREVDLQMYRLNRVDLRDAIEIYSAAIKTSKLTMELVKRLIL